MVEPDRIFGARELLDQVYVDEKVLSYLVDLAFATRRPEEAGLADLKTLIMYGVSPRGKVSETGSGKAPANSAV